MKINNVEVEILIKGRPVRVLPFNGKVFIEARYDSEYEIRIRNDNYYRVMAVASVDGLSVLDGKPADKDGVGYVLNGYSSMSIKGFRSDNNTVGAFKFTKKKKGYAKEVTGSSENSGIIAVAVFAEKQPVITWQSAYAVNNYYNTCEQPRGGSCGGTTTEAGGNSVTITNGSLNSANFVNSASSVNIQNCSATYSCGDSLKIGSRVGGQGVLRSFSPQKVQEEVPNFSAATSWGTKLTDRVTTTTFEKASSHPMAEFSIYYDIRQNLEKIGIVFENEKQIAYPKAFPNGFATPPVGWHS